MLSKTQKARIIKRVVCRKYGVTLAELDSKTRRAEVVLPRHVSWYFMRDLLGMGAAETARHHQRVDHTTVLHACAKISAYIAVGDVSVADVEKLKKKISKEFSKAE